MYWTTNHSNGDGDWSHGDYTVQQNEQHDFSMGRTNEEDTVSDRNQKDSVNRVNGITDHRSQSAGWQVTV